MILLIDNYDSFVFNLSRYLQEMGCETVVKRNDCISIGEVEKLNPEAVVLSPGPCTPDEAGICVELVRQLKPSIPILGVCLGHQCLAAAHGGKIVRATEPVHGRTSLIQHAGSDLFAGIPTPFTATRYHSLIVDEKSLPSELLITARGPEKIPMSIQHRTRPLFGVQFHPESILTLEGRRLIQNFLKLCGREVGELPKEELAVESSEPVLPTSPPLHW
jgi:anthranilate synthase component II